MENQIIWNDRYNIGVDIIDKQHKKLFRILNKLFILEQRKEKSQWVCQEAIKYFKDHTLEHFQDEEEYMENIRYPGLQAQKRAHRIFVSKLEELDLEQLDDNQQEYLEELMEFLFGWLSNHILKSDKLIAE